MENTATKAWTLDLDDYSEPWYISDPVVYANTKGEARMKFLDYLAKEGVERQDGEEITFINIRVRRDKTLDKKLWRGELVSFKKYSELEKEVNHEKELDRILADDSITFCYIKKRGAYYCSNYRGYTEVEFFAGIYPKKDAVKHASRITEITLIPIKNEEAIAALEQENIRLQEKIKQLQHEI